MKKVLFLVIILFSTTVFANLDTNLFPNQDGFVVDSANIIDDTIESQLETELQSYRDQGIAQISVVTIQTLNDYPIEDYGIELGRFWGVGEKEKNNGVIFLISVADRAMRIEVGYGLEGALTDAESSWIIKDVTPYFQSGKYTEGIQFGTNAIIEAVANEYAPTQPSSKRSNINFNTVFILGIFAISWLGGILGRSRRIWPGGLLGGIAGGLGGFFMGLGFFAILAAVITGIFGLLFDKLVSGKYQSGSVIPWWAGGRNNWWDNHGGGGGGFGGGSFGGGGASGRW